MVLPKNPIPAPMVVIVGPASNISTGCVPYLPTTKASVSPPIPPPLLQGQQSVLPSGQSLPDGDTERGLHGNVDEELRCWYETVIWWGIG